MMDKICGHQYYVKKQKKPNMIRVRKRDMILPFQDLKDSHKDDSKEEISITGEKKKTTKSLKYHRFDNSWSKATRNFLPPFHFEATRISYIWGNKLCIHNCQKPGDSPLLKQETQKQPKIDLTLI